MQNIELNNGMFIPPICYGTCAIGQWQQDDDYVVETILTAIKAGYRHFDTASLYGNERSLGKAIKASGIAREEFFIVTKLWDTQQGFQQTLQACEESLVRLQMDYVDLYLIHWPVPQKTQATWQAMEQLHEQGKIRALGLSNFRESDITQLLSFANIKPVYNQLELHPYLTQEALCQFCNEQDIIVSCWSPLGTGTWNEVPVNEKPIADPTIVALAKKYNVSAGQIILKWDIQQGRIVMPKAESEINMRNNLALDHFELDEQELASINRLNKNHRYGGDPDTTYADNMAIDVPA